MEELLKAMQLLVERIKKLERIFITPLIVFVAATYQNSWVDFNAGNQSAGYYRDMVGFIHLRGVVKNGTVNTPIFTLPAGYRPIKELRFSVVSNGAIGLLIVAANGDVTLVSGSNTYVSLDGILFQAEQ